MTRNIHGFALVALAALLVQCPPPACAARGGDPSNVITVLTGDGAFVLHKFEQPIGRETYRVTREGDSLTVRMDFKFTDRGGAVPLSAVFRGDLGLRPVSFTIKGKTSRSSAIDAEVQAYPETIRVRDHDTWKSLERPERYFTIAGYAPVTMQMLMVRYWETHGSPSELSIFPGTRVSIERRGRDTINFGNRAEALTRYTVRGLIWGRETLWTDSRSMLIAAVTTDAEFDHFEAVREGYESALGTFVDRAAADGMNALAEMSRGIARTRSDTIAVVGGTLINGTGTDPVHDACVLIENGVIASAGPRAGVEIPRSAQLVDARGKTILPGLWDMHAHVEQVEWGPIYLAAGVTTVRDCGNEFEFITAVRDAIAGGRGLGPRILAAGIVDGSGPQAIGVARADTPEAAQEWTDRYHAAGFQQMKIYSSMKLENVRAVAVEAHRLGMTVTGHVPMGLNAFQVVEAGQDQINHIDNILSVMLPPIPPGTGRLDRFRALANIDLNSPEVRSAIKFFREHGTVIDPTLALAEFFGATTARPPSSFEPGAGKVAPELAGMLFDVSPPSAFSGLRDSLLMKEIATVGALHRGGVAIVAGTDQTVPGHSLHREIELYVQAGFTPMEAIQAATIVPARVMKLDRESGTLEPGKRGDLIIVDGNPLENISAIRQVRFVIAGGAMYSTAELWRSVGFTP
jgi:imidazolonepropionase-like amidohydrolase